MALHIKRFAAEREAWDTQKEELEGQINLINEERDRLLQDIDNYRKEVENAKNEQKKEQLRHTDEIKTIQSSFAEKEKAWAAEIKNVEEIFREKTTLESKFMAAKTEILELKARRFLKSEKIEHAVRIFANFDAKSLFSDFNFANSDVFDFTKVVFFLTHQFCKFIKSKTVKFQKRVNLQNGNLKNAI